MKRQEFLAGLTCLHPFVKGAINAGGVRLGRTESL